MSSYIDDRSYTDRRRTRVYRSPQAEPAPQPDTIGQTQALQPKEKLFSGISPAQLIAGAAAAATSVALSSYIGVAGSIIGAAVSSVVTVIASQIYRRALDASARKLKDAGERAQATILSGQSGSADATTVAPLAPGAHHARIAPSELRERAAAERAATQRKVVVFSVIAAAAAVAVCAGAILIGTAGEGIGEKTEPLNIPTAIVRDPQDTTGTASTGAGKTPSGTADTTTEGQQDTDATNPVTPDASAGTTDTTTDDTATGTDGGTDTGDGSTGTSSNGSTTGSTTDTGTDGTTAGGTGGSTGSTGTGTTGDATSSGTGTTSGSEATGASSSNSSSAR